MTVTRTFRRRIDYQVLRWQARLDGAWADRVIPIVATVALFLVLAGLSLARARSLETGYDLAHWVQGAWLVTTGRAAESTITDRHLLEPQLAIGFYGVAQLTRILAPIPLLLVAQAAALSMGIGAIWRLCRQVCDLRVGATAAAVVAYAAYPPLHQLNLADVHPEALALPALLWGAYAALRGRWLWVVPLFLFAVSMRSDLGLTVAAVGATLLLSGRARGGRRLMAAGLAWTLVAQFVIQPQIGGDGFVHQEAFSRYGDDGAAIAWGMLTAPWDVIGDLLGHQNFVVLVGLLAPVAFLPVLAPRRLLPFAPAVAVAFIADVPILGADGVEHLVPAIVGVFLALPFALEQLGRRHVERVTVDRRLLAALAMAAGTFFVLDAPSSPYERPWEWGGRDAADAVRLEVVAELDPDLAVRTAPSLAAELAEREVLRVVPQGEVPGPVALVDRVDVLVLDSETAESWELDDEEIDDLHAALADEGWTVFVDADGIWAVAAEG